MKFSFITDGGKFPKDALVITVSDAKDDDLVRLPSGGRELVMGAGPADKMTRRKLVLLLRRALCTAKAKRARQVAFDLETFRFPHLEISDVDLAETVAVGFLMAHHAFTEHKTTPPEGWPEVKKIFVSGAQDQATQAAFRKGQIIGEETNACRRLANLPGGEVTPETLAAEAKRIAKGTPIKVKILDVGAMTKLKMGGILGVGKGSEAKPKFIIMEYLTGPKTEEPIVLIGKGVTFDTGGLNLKPSLSLGKMNMDMSGGAAVIHALSIAARLKLKKNIVGLIPAVENMPSGASYRPGDILHSMSGKTIEVLNTDAEGRIILADALTYANRYHPRLVVDVATLTGAAEVALGQRATALFTNSLELEQRFREWGEESGDYVWPLPLWDEYEEDITGFFGDWANASIGKTQGGGAIMAALFLKQFINSYPWAHLDIAPRMTAIEGECLEKGAAGAPVRLLVKVMEEY